MKMFVLFQLQKTKKFWGFFCGKFNQFDTDLNMMMVVWGNFVFANDIGRARVAWSASWSTTFNLIYVNCFKITLKGWTPYQTELFIKVERVFCSIKGISFTNQTLKCSYNDKIILILQNLSADNWIARLVLLSILHSFKIDLKQTV